MSKNFLTVAFAACLFLLIVAAKWTTFDRYGSPMPDWDQWDAEGSELLIPWVEGDHFVSHLFHAHNEHYVIMTKLQNLTLGLLNGQWDSRLEASTNAMLHAAIATALWLFGRRRLTAWWHAALFALIFVLFGLPVAWQNVLGGFHSQQYWLLGLSLIAIVTLPFTRPASGAWWLGAAAALFALATMGSGLLAAAVVIGLVGWRCWQREVRLRDVWPTLVLAASIAALGWATRVDAPWHAHMKAKTISAFLLSTVHSLQWPWRDHDGLGAILWLPWVLTFGRVLRWPRGHRGEDARTSNFLRSGQIVAAIGGWVLVQIAATAYARGGDGGYPASRYMDTLAVGVAANALAVGWLLSVTGVVRAVRAAHVVVALAWLAAFGFGCRPLLGTAFEAELPDAKKYYNKAEGNMRRYLATNDAKHLAHPEIPYPSAESLMDRLARPSLRAFMPVPIRTPLPLETAATGVGGPPAFERNDARSADPAHPPRLGLSPAIQPLDYTPTWGSFGDATQGEWRSAPVTPTRRGGWLRFETAGQLGEPGIELELRDVASNDVIAQVRPSKVPGDAWRSAYVPQPAAPFVVVARDLDPTRWLAFSGPVEMGPLSYWAWQANKHAPLLFMITAAVTALLALATLRVRRPE